MKLQWWMVGVIAVVAGGSFLLLRSFRSKNGVAYHFVDDEVALKNFGAFPPELPEDEFDGVNFLF
ncbi:MAG: hypothetical protein HY276_03780 [Ignavibacteriales bacterium]|nr:hypothetical protein [Ignavibacteriales bacterium]MBI3787357.1 hypothetical protein [Ignavibacteriales bacterium]